MKGACLGLALVATLHLCVVIATRVFQHIWPFLDARMPPLPPSLPMQSCVFGASTVLGQSGMRSRLHLISPEIYSKGGITPHQLSLQFMDCFAYHSSPVTARVTPIGFTALRKRHATPSLVREFQCLPVLQAVIWQGEGERGRLGGGKRQRGRDSFQEWGRGETRGNLAKHSQALVMELSPTAEILILVCLSHMISVVLTSWFSAFSTSHNLTYPRGQNLKHR